MQAPIPVLKRSAAANVLFVAFLSSCQVRFTRTEQWAHMEAHVDINYLFLRQQVERSRAKVATSNVARAIHEQLAGEYERQIEQLSDGRVKFISGMPQRVSDR